MDALDSSLMYHLEDDYRTSTTELAACLGVARSTVKRRLVSLFRQGTFEGYQIEIDRLALGLERLVYLEVKTNPREDWLLNAIESLDQCIQSDGVIGDYGLVFKMVFRSGGELAGRLRALDSLIASSASKRYRIIDVIERYKERGLVNQSRPDHQLDDVDRSLLRVLLDQGSWYPLPLWRLSKRLEGELDRGLSRSAIQKRIQRMSEAGVIRQFTIRPRRWIREGGVRAYIRLKMDPGQTRIAATNVLAKMPEILSLYRTGEDYGLFSEVFVRDLASLDGLLKSLYGIDGLIDTMTTIVLERRKELPVRLGALA